MRTLVIKLSLWVPVLIQMGLIYYFSSQPSGSPAVEGFPLVGWMGHFGGYFLLGALLYRALAGGIFRWKVSAAWLALLGATAYGVLDEIHQMYVPGRHASAVDVMVDAVGAAAALLAVRAGILVRERAGDKRGERKRLFAFHRDRD